MRTSRLFVFGALTASFGWLLAGGCSSSDSDGNAAGPAGGGSLSDAQGGITVVMKDASNNLGGSGGSLNSLCGAGECVPDDGLACRGYEPLPAPPGAGGAAGADGFSGAGYAGADGFGGAGAQQGGTPAGGIGTTSGGQAGRGGADNEGAPGGAGQSSGGEAGTGGAGPVPVLRYGCQVSRKDNELVRGCEAAGLGKVNAPCFSAADCEPALACISEGDTGRCLQYCCDAAASCTLGTYCAERELRESSPVARESATPTPRVPVCVPADDCSLEDVFPCPEGTDCRCKGDTACVVVRADGTTTCLVPGAGLQGEECPCAWNHVCSSATQKCVKICRTDPAKNDCGPQKCQASSELPQNFGVCVGPIK